MIVFKKSIIFIFLLLSFSMSAKDIRNDSVSKNKINFLDNSILFGVSYAYQQPSGMLLKRFGFSNSLGFSTSYKFGPNIFIQGGIDVFFGSDVKETGILDSITGPSGQLIDAQGNLISVKLYQRGYVWHFNIGKIIPLSRMNLNSGLLFTGGCGFMQHKIKFQYSRGTVPQLDGQNFMGYDRLTNGLMLRGFVGYQRIDPLGMFNYFAGVEFLQGYTYNRRSLNYDTRVRELARRNDILTGIKIGIMVKISGKQAGRKKGENDNFFE